MLEREYVPPFANRQSPTYLRTQDTGDPLTTNPKTNTVIMAKSSAAKTEGYLHKKRKSHEHENDCRRQRYAPHQLEMPSLVSGIADQEATSHPLQVSAVNDSTPTDTSPIVSATSQSQLFNREPRGSSEVEKKKLAELLVKDAARPIPCSVEGCDHAGFALSAYKTNQNLLKKYEEERAQNPAITKPSFFDVPRLEDKSVAWDEPLRWTKMHSGKNYNNYLRGLTSHYAFMISVRKCKEHKEKCPKVLVTRAQKALNSCKDPGTSNHNYRKLWEVLELEKTAAAASRSIPAGGNAAANLSIEAERTKCSQGNKVQVVTRDDVLSTTGLPCFWCKATGKEIGMENFAEKGGVGTNEWYPLCFDCTTRHYEEADIRRRKDSTISTSERAESAKLTVESSSSGCNPNADYLI